MKHIRYFIEAILLYSLFFIFGILPVDTASNFGGWVGRTIGPRLAASRKATRNLESAIPNLSDAEKTKIIREMWDNLGRIIAEYPHLETIGRTRTTIEGREILENAFKGEQGNVFWGGHIGNWEVVCGALLTQFNMPMDISYRAPNNPWSDKILSHARSLGGKLRSFPKSRSGGKELLTAAKAGRNIGILIDQKYNEGLAVPFFSMPAMTNPVYAQLGQKYGCRLIPMRNIRTKGANFILRFYEPQESNGALEDVIQKSHIIMEDWIREHPGQWLWLHRRWDSEALKKN